MLRSLYCDVVAYKNSEANQAPSDHLHVNKGLGAACDAVFCCTLQNRIREKCSHFVAYRPFKCGVMQGEHQERTWQGERAGRNTEKQLGWCRYYTERIPLCGMAVLFEKETM